MSSATVSPSSSWAAKAIQLTKLGGTVADDALHSPPLALIAHVPRDSRGTRHVASRSAVALPLRNCFVAVVF